jgi:hypothetical protein
MLEPFRLAIVSFLVMLAPWAVGQNAVQRPPDGGNREVLISILIPSLPNAPFSAIVNTESIRQLPNGATITLKNHRAVARDSAGRIFQERRLLVPEDGKHESVVTQIEISDPVAHELFICVPKEEVCQVEAFTAPTFQPPRSASDAPRSGPATLEDLGKQSISGVETVGTRETVVIEAGKIGNDSPLQVQREYWYSPQLGVNLLSKLHDPRIGIQNFEVSDIAMTEPDTKLFKVSGKVKIIDLRRGATAPKN